MQEAYERLLSFLPTQASIEQANRIASTSARSLVDNRVFEEGEDATGQLIGGGNYSSSPMLVGASSFITKAAARKFFKREGLEWRRIEAPNGKLVNLAILSGGYKELRELDGRKTDKVRLRRTFTMRNSMSQQPKEDGFDLGFLNEFEGMKARSLENKYDQPIFKLSEEEIEEVIGIYLSTFKPQT